MTSTSLYEQYVAKMHTIADLRHASAVLQWDQETYLPSKGAPFRGQQISTLSEMSHQLFSAPELGTLLQALQEAPGLTEQQRRNVQLSQEDYQKNKKYSSSFVRALSEQVNKTYHCWIEARKANSFAVYATELDKLIALKRQEADLLGYEGHPYDALLDEFEKGSTVTLLDRSFSELIPQLQPILDQIAGSQQVDDSFLKLHYPRQQQWDWGMELLQQLNFDFAAGRQDLSEHPFSTSFNTRDVRITTRIDEADFGNMTWSTIHEAGHALYEQGLPETEYGLPLGEACSYSIHESQSRLWENNVGRSKAFWSFHYPRLLQLFPQQLRGVTLDTFYKGINKVSPSLIRTEADEITYHFHVYIRYQLEKQLIEGSISTNDIPAFWNEQYLKLLKITVPDDKRGCLQDVHWSHGSFGYFPTYSLGSFYAAQFFRTADQAIEGLNAQLESGNTRPLLEWLRQNIHEKGRFHTSEGLCKAVTGENLNVRYFVDYLLQKYRTVYTLV